MDTGQLSGGFRSYESGTGWRWKGVRTLRHLTDREWWACSYGRHSRQLLESEGILQRELNFPVRQFCAGYLAESSVAQIGIRVGELRLVQGIECFGAELQGV